MVTVGLDPPHTQGLACHVVDDLIERIVAGTRCQTGGCLLGKGALMSVPSIPTLDDDGEATVPS